MSLKNEVFLFTTKMDGDLIASCSNGRLLITFGQEITYDKVCFMKTIPILRWLIKCAIFCCNDKHLSFRIQYSNFCVLRIFQFSQFYPFIYTASKKSSHPYQCLCYKTRLIFKPGEGQGECRHLCKLGAFLTKL